MTDATFQTAFVDFEIEYELAFVELKAAVLGAASNLEFPSKGQTVARMKVEDLHVEVRDRIACVLKDHCWRMNRAWRAIKQARRMAAGG